MQRETTMNLALDMYEIPNNCHPIVAMKNLGITYQMSIPQTIADQWWFFCCNDVPTELPSYLSEFKKDNNFRSLIGLGLSEKDCIMLENYIKEKQQ